MGPARLCLRRARGSRLPALRGLQLGPAGLRVATQPCLLAMPARVRRRRGRSLVRHRRVARLALVERRPAAGVHRRVPGNRWRQLGAGWAQGRGRGPEARVAHSRGREATGRLWRRARRARGSRADREIARTGRADPARHGPAQSDRARGTVTSTRRGRVPITMENRKEAILRAVVHEFTTSAVPVGSRSLHSRYFVNLSSATIRSELAELADRGYLIQPHTSAGRIPTDSGYRYFVDFLMDLEEVPDRVRVFINEELGHATADVQGLVERVAMTTAAVTQNASVASAPHGSQGRIKHVDLVSLEPKEVLLILLLEGNLLRQQVVQVTEAAGQPELTLLASKLNGTLVGKAGEEVRRRYDGAALGLEKELLGRIVAALDQYEQGAENLVVHDGVRNLLRQPEFAESSRLQQVLEVLEETRYLTVLLHELIGNSDLQIVIGSENASSQLQGCAVVLTTYGPSNRLKGVLGVIGPTRMAYSQTVARLRAVARSANDRMAELGV